MNSRNTTIVSSYEDWELYTESVLQKRELNKEVNNK